MGRQRRVLTPDQSPAHLWGSQLRALRDARTLSLVALGERARYDPGYLGRLERGDQFGTRSVAEACDQALGAGGGLVALWDAADHERRKPAEGPPSAAGAQSASPGAGQPLDDRERRLVEVMSLHAITASYGTAGLWARFEAESAKRLDAAGQQDVARALELAARLHEQDRRQREPYVNHLLRVALRIMCHYGVSDPEVISAALLHDAVEDHEDQLAIGGGREAALAALSAGFGPRVAGLVAAVTNPVYPPGADRHAEYRLHVMASLEGNPWARVIKLSDFTDNGGGIHYTTGPKAVKLAAKYAPLVPPLSGLVARPDTPLHPQVKTLILGQLLDAQQRFEALLPGSADA